MLRLIRTEDAVPRGSGPEALDDGALMLLVARDHEGAFSELLRRHEARVRRYLSRMVGPEEAFDLCQDTFATLWRTRHRYREEGRFTVLLYRIARNRALSHLRWRKVRAVFAREAAFKDAPHEAVSRALGPDGLSVVLDEERDQRLCRVLGGLPLPFREAVVLRHAEGLDYATISALTGVPVGTLRARVHRGLALLRKRLEARDAP